MIERRPDASCSALISSAAFSPAASSFDLKFLRIRTPCSHPDHPPGDHSVSIFEPSDVEQLFVFHAESCHVNWATWLRLKLKSRGELEVKMGRPTGLEPATPRFTILCSNQLSYDRRKLRKGETFRSAQSPVNPFPGCVIAPPDLDVYRCPRSACASSPSISRTGGAYPDPGPHLVAQASPEPEADRGPAGQTGRGHRGAAGDRRMLGLGGEL